MKALELRASGRAGALAPVQTLWFGVQRAWERFWYPPTDSFDLGFARFLFFAWILYSTGRRNFNIWGDLPIELFYPLPFMRLINYPVASAATVEILQNIWRLSLICGCVGFLTRLSALVACLLTLYLWTLMYGFLQEAHGSIPLIFTMFILAASRSADSFSIDSFIFRFRRKPTEASPDYGWPTRLICCVYVLMFFGSAVTKLINSGIEWGLYSLTNIFYQFRLRANPRAVAIIDFFLDNVPMKLVGMGALLLELAAPLALFPGLIRAIVLPALIIMQLLIFEAMGLDFRPTFGLIPFFIPWSGLRRFLSGRARLWCAWLRNRVA